MLHKSPDEPAELWKLRKRNFAKCCDTGCFDWGCRGLVYGEKLARVKLNPEDQGEEGEVKDMMEKGH